MGRSSACRRCDDDGASSTRVRCVSGSKGYHLRRRFFVERQGSLFIQPGRATSLAAKRAEHGRLRSPDRGVAIRETRRHERWRPVALNRCLLPAQRKRRGIRRRRRSARLRPRSRRRRHGRRRRPGLRPRRRRLYVHPERHRRVAHVRVPHRHIRRSSHASRRRRRIWRARRVRRGRRAQRPNRRRRLRVHHRTRRRLGRGIFRLNRAKRPKSSNHRPTIFLQYDAPDIHSARDARLRRSASSLRVPPHHVSQVPRRRRAAAQIQRPARDTSEDFRPVSRPGRRPGRFDAQESHRRHRQVRTQNQRRARRRRAAVLQSARWAVLSDAARVTQVPGHDAQAPGGQGSDQVCDFRREHHVPGVDVERGDDARRMRGRRTGGDIRGRKGTRAGCGYHEDEHGGDADGEQRNRGGFGALFEGWLVGSDGEVRKRVGERERICRN